MTNFEWFLLIVVVIVVPLIVAVVVTLWTIDQANKRKRQNRADAQIGVKRKAALSPEEVEQRRVERARRQAEADAAAASAQASTGAAGTPPPPPDVSRETSTVADDDRSG
jgi:FtsZ-interacting cell division protein ZipA